MVKRRGWILWLLICSLILPGTMVEAKSSKKPKLSKAKLTLNVGASKKLTVKKKRKLKVKKVTFSSSKKRVAKVTKKGKIKALRKGKTTITCKVILKNKKKYRLKCKVTVKNAKKKTEEEAASKTPVPNKPEGPKKTTEPSGTKNPQESNAPSKTEVPEETAAPSTIAPSETGKPQESTVPSETGKPQESTVPSETGKPQESTVPSKTGKPEESSVPSESSTPQRTMVPSGTKFPHISKNGIATQDNGEMREGIDAYDIVWDMGLGTNLGNTLESCGTWIDPSSVTNFETAWGAPVTTQEMLTGMKKAGFSSIRIPVGWSNMMADDGKYMINEAYFNRVETVMNYALNEDMYVIINIHFDGGWWARFGSKDETERQEAMKKYQSMWLQIANRFEEYSDKVIFESANEELGARLNSTDDYAGSGYFTSEDQLFQQTNIINQTFVDVVRGTGGNNAKRYLMIAGYDTNIGLTCDVRYKMPKDVIDRHMFVSIHYYSPAPYCIADDPENSWGYSDTWGTEQDIAEMKNELGNMRTHFVNKGYPVIIGEYGVCDSTIDGKKVKKKGRDLFFKTVCEYATENNMCPMLWDANQIFDRRTCTMLDEADRENYLSLSQKIRTKPIVKPEIVKGVARWSGKLSYSGWSPKDVFADNTNTFSIRNVGGCFVINGIDWGSFERPVMKVTYMGTGAGDSMTSKWYHTVKDDPYWTAPYDDGTGLIANGELQKGKEVAVDLSGANLTDNQRLFFTLGAKEMEGQFTITVQSGN